MNRVIRVLVFVLGTILVLSAFAINLLVLRSPLLISTMIAAGVFCAVRVVVGTEEANKLAGGVAVAAFLMAMLISYTG